MGRVHAAWQQLSPSGRPPESQSHADTRSACSLKAGPSLLFGWLSREADRIQSVALVWKLCLSTSFERLFPVGGAPLIGNLIGFGTIAESWTTADCLPLSDEPPGTEDTTE